MLLLTNGPSIVAVRLGASRISSVIDRFDGLRWCSEVTITGSNSSAQPSNHNSALTKPRLSVSASSTLIDHAPDGVTKPEMLLLPFTLDVKDK